MRKTVDKLDTIPKPLCRLRWRVISKKGLEVYSSWTPEIRYPSMTEILKEFDGDIAEVHVDGKDNTTDMIGTILSCPGDSFKSFSYKVMVDPQNGVNLTVGIEIETQTGKKFMALRDGSIYQEAK